MTSRRITDRQRAVIDTMRMHLRPKQALLYLKDNGHEMAESTLYGWKRMIKKTVQERLYEVAQYEFPEQHLEAIEEIRTARKLMWENVHKVKDPFKQNIMVQNIINTLPLRSSYYDATKGVIEKPESKEDNPIQESEQQQPNEWV
jgi:hypothetical protein